MALSLPDHQHASTLEQLNRRLRPALVAFFMRRLGNPVEAEDLTQEVFVRLASMDLAQMESAEAYVFRMAANLIRDRSRRETVRFEFRKEAMTDDQGGIDTLDPSRFAAGRQSLDKLVAALQELPEQTRTAFILYRLEHVDRRDIARAFDISQSTVDRHLARAMAHLIERVRVVE